MPQSYITFHIIINFIKNHTLESFERESPYAIVYQKLNVKYIASVFIYKTREEKSGKELTGYYTCANQLHIISLSKTHVV